MPCCVFSSPALCIELHVTPQHTRPGQGSSARVPLGYCTLASRNERPGMDEPAVLFGEWPLTLSRKRVGERIRQLTDLGRVRHDLLVDKSRVGRIIGQRGSTLQALLQVRLC